MPSFSIDDVPHNEGNAGTWEEGVRKWTDWMKAPDKDIGHPYSARYVGSMVADFHRTLLKGGIFAYPADKKNPNGKLRLMYEANPMSMILEAAGGQALACAGDTGPVRRILDILPESIHERTSVILGSSQEVQAVLRFVS